MPEYLVPGVYVGELPAGSRAIAGVSTAAAGFVGQAERGPSRPRLVASWAEYQRWFGGFTDRGAAAGAAARASPYLPYAVRGFFENGGRRLYVARVTGAGAPTATATLPGARGTTIVRAVGPGAWGDRVLVLVARASASLQARADAPAARWFRLRLLYYRDGVRPTPVHAGAPAPVPPDVSEDFDDLSPVEADPNFAAAVVNGRSSLVEVTACHGTPRETRPPGMPLAGGGDATVTLDDYLDARTTDPDRQEGLAGLAGIPEIALLAAPDEALVPGLSAALLDACEARRDRFAVLGDAAPGGSGDPRQVQPVRDSSYGALYTPWLRVLAAHLPEGTRLVPPQGHVAGVYARTDLERGVHAAPANEVVHGLASREPLSRIVGQAEQDLLVPRGVNVIRDLAGRGVRVWGARTMSSDPEWRYVNVRRLLIYLEQSIQRGTRWAVFEPNGEPTWAAVRLAIEAFLLDVWRGGALLGSKPDEAFFVRCDRTTMTQADLDAGRLICLVGIAPVRPAQFVVFRVAQALAPGAA